MAITVLATFVFLASYQSTKYFGDFPTDPAVIRQQLIDEGAVSGLPPEELDRILDEMVASQVENNRRMMDEQLVRQSAYAFPQSLLTVLGNVSFAVFALILMTTLTIGDEFSWGTIRGSLLASSRRSSFLLTRFVTLAGAGVLLLAILALLGLLLPFVVRALDPTLPAGAPVDGGGFALLLLSLFVIELTVIAFATLATLIVRSGGLTLVLVLVYVAIETAIQGLLFRIPDFQPDGDLEWVPKLLPVRAIAALLHDAAAVAGAVPQYIGEVVNRDVGLVSLPLGALAAWAAAFTVLAFWRFERMDIAE